MWFGIIQHIAVHSHIKSFCVLVFHFPWEEQSSPFWKSGKKAVDKANFSARIVLTHFSTQCSHCQGWEDGAENQTPSLSTPDSGPLQQMTTNWSMENWLTAGSLPVCPCRLARYPILVKTGFCFSFEPLNIPGSRLLRKRT